MDRFEGQIALQRYRIRRLIGVGGMGSVFEGEDIQSGRRVALKVLRREAPQEAFQRFSREALLASRVGSPHMVEIYDSGTMKSGESVLVMEYLEGETLEKRLMRLRRISIDVATPIFEELLTALASAHEKGVIHRDLKPENVFLIRRGDSNRDFVKVLDFGISKFAELYTSPEEATQTGAFMGTPLYMSPEQMRSARSVDARTDVYSVGVMLYEVLTGTSPYAGATLADLLERVLARDFHNPRKVAPFLSQELSEVIVRAMDPDPDVRFPSARHLRAALLNAVTKMKALEGKKGISDDDSNEPTAFYEGDRHRPIAPPSRASGQENRGDQTVDLKLLAIPVIALLIVCAAVLAFVLFRNGPGEAVSGAGTTEVLNTPRAAAPRSSGTDPGGRP